VLVSHLHKFIYTKTMKTAGTSVEAYFERFCMADPDQQVTELREEAVSAAGIIGARSLRANGKNYEWWNHMPAMQIRQKLGPQMFDSYFKFCCVRNPFDKTLSAYFWYDDLRQIDLPRTMPEAERFQTWLEEKGPPLDRNKYCIAGRYVMDDVVRHESLPADMERICGKLGVAWEPERLPKFKVGVRPEGRTFDEMYTPRARALVREKYAFELELFGYDFPAETVPA
jgi:hypothetical protein